MATQKDIEIGRLVMSTAGRDANSYFAIVGKIDKDYVLIADGEKRRLNKPKKKKIKHLYFSPVVLETVKEKIENNEKVFDAQLRSAIRLKTLEDTQTD